LPPYGNHVPAIKMRSLFPFLQRYWPVGIHRVTLSSDQTPPASPPHIGDSVIQVINVQISTSGGTFSSQIYFLRHLSLCVSTIFKLCDWLTMHHHVTQVPYFHLHLSEIITRSKYCRHHGRSLMEGQRAMLSSEQRTVQTSKVVCLRPYEC
jgi:hypothetical protein